MTLGSPQQCELAGHDAMQLKRHTCERLSSTPWNMVRVWLSTTSQQPCKSSTDLGLLTVRKLANSEEASKLRKSILDNLEIHQRPFSFLAASAHGMGE